MAHHRVQDLAEKPTGGEHSQAAAAASARETLLNMLSTNDVIGASSQVIDMLRTREYDISDLFRESSLVKSDALPEEVALVDELLERCISRTALVHERAIESMLHGYCEIGLDGRILYANPSFLNLVPDAVGQSLFDLFSEIAEPTDFAYDTPDIRRFELLTASGSRSLSTATTRARNG